MIWGDYWINRIDEFCNNVLIQTKGCENIFNLFNPPKSWFRQLTVPVKYFFENNSFVIINLCQIAFQFISLCFSCIIFKDASNQRLSLFMDISFL